MNTALIYHLLTSLLISTGLYAAAEPHHTTAFIGLPGQIDVLNAFSTYHTRSFWNSKGQKRCAYNCFDQKTYFFYLEYAVNSCNSLALNGAYSMVDESLNGRSCSLSDIELSWKLLINSTESSAFTAQLISIIPSGHRKPSIRYSTWGGQADLLYSQVFSILNGCRAWYDLSAGYRYYQGYPSNQTRAAGALGLEIGSAFWAIASGQLEYGLSNKNTKTRWNASTFNPVYRLLNIQIECIFKIIPHTFITLGTYTHAWGKNVGTSGGFFCGTWLDF